MNTEVFSPELQQWLAYGVMTGFSDEAMLEQSPDLPREPLLKLLAELRQSPLAAVGGQFARQVVNLQWLLNLQTQLEQTSPYRELVTLQSHQIEEIRRDYLFANRPVKIQGLLEDWPARQWTPGYLRGRWGSQPIQFTERGAGSQTQTRHGTLGEFLDCIQAPANHGQHYWTAYNQTDASGLLAQLSEGVREIPGLCRPLQEGKVYYWIGPGGTRSGLHFDPYNVLFAQLRGSKKFYLLPPSSMPRLYLYNDFFSPVDLEHRDSALYPLSEGLMPIETEVHEGEVLLLPVGWFHQVTSLSYSVSISLTNLDLPGGNHYKAPSAYRGVL
ncbi:MAG: cupin-like domain-containing protein [Candidatus Eremiobacteraeota bacterium]|nr:cupin-like domain-containing protein [Candidatus Eremiobacteraeota bacterium]